MNGRADTPKKKRAVIERVYAAWCRNPGLRLGQMLDTFTPGDLFYIEDDELASELDKR